MSYQHLSQEERYLIAALSKSRLSKAEIGRQIHRPTSTITREMKRNRCTSDQGYRAEVAHSYATARRRRERRGPHFTIEQWAIVLQLLKYGLSPEQISNAIRLYCDFTISHETIYKYILYDKRRGGSLYKYLRIMPKRRRKRYNSYDSRGVLRGKRHISKRPKAVESRHEIGHWEGDTVIGSDRHHCIVTLVERATGFVIIKKISARTAFLVSQACIQAIKEHKRKFITITFDNGTEFHSYKEIEAQTSVKCFFATPYHSWERGTNENTNGLIRQYLPKKTCMKHVTQEDCDRIAYRLNTRPRKRYGYRTPEQLYYGKDTALHLLLEPKAIKQNLKIKRFYGTSRNAVFTQIWIALIAYLLFCILKFSTNARRTFTCFSSVFPTVIFRYAHCVTGLRIHHNLLTVSHKLSVSWNLYDYFGHY